MAVAGIPLSLLARQALVLGSGFAARYQHAWLVWEPGARMTPSPTKPELVSTLVPVERGPRTPGYGDPLCFPLNTSPEGQPTCVGRAPESDLVLDDLTVSREHFELWNQGDDWFITVPEQSHALTQVRNNSLQVGERMKLIDGCSIIAGGVTLTFARRGKLFPRVMAAAERLPQTS
jgi:hypothetical protein